MTHVVMRMYKCVCVCVPSGSFLTDVFIVRVSYCFLQTLLEQEIDSDRISALELGTRRKHNLARLEEVRYSNEHIFILVFPYSLLS